MSQVPHPFAAFAKGWEKHSLSSPSSRDYVTRTRDQPH
jgi:hypothetical protein